MAVLFSGAEVSEFKEHPAEDGEEEEEDAANEIFVEGILPV